MKLKWTSFTVLINIPGHILYVYISMIQTNPKAPEVSKYNVLTSHVVHIY